VWIPARLEWGLGPVDKEGAIVAFALPLCKADFP
jgi:hypothetical protein